MNLMLPVRVQEAPIKSQKSEMALTLVAVQTDDSAEDPCPKFCNAARREELDRLLRKHRPLIKKLCAGYARLREDAEDLEGTVLMTACRRFASYDPERGAFGTWLGAIVRNEAADIRRRKQRQVVCIPNTSAVEAVIDRTPAKPERILDSSDATQEFRLSPLVRRAFDLVKLQGLTCAEAGAVLGKTEGTVRTYIWKARQIIRGVGR